jgi:hypothetical protein
MELVEVDYEIGSKRLMKKSKIRGRKKERL